jgi:hypothetical protein
MVNGGCGDLVAGIRRIWAGELDEDELCDELDREDSLIVGGDFTAVEIPPNPP